MPTNTARFQVFLCKLADTRPASFEVLEFKVLRNRRGSVSLKIEM